MSALEKQPARQLALITGATSGIGQALAQTFARNGFNLLITAETDAIKTTAETLRGFGVRVDAIQVDLANEQGVEALCEKINDLGRPIDVAAINAGVAVSGEFINTSFTEELNVIQLNIISMVQLSKFLLKLMAARGEGKILFTSSIAAEMPGPYYAVYAASKAFVQSFVEAIRFEATEKKLGVTITALQPGATDTNFFKRAHMENTRAGTGQKDDPAVVAQDGFDALMAGKDHVIAGAFKNTLQVGVARFISEKQAAAVQARSTRPGSGKR